METKPGYKTTEFWLSLAAVVVGALMASGAFSDGGVVMKLLGLAATLLAAFGYTWQRSKTKQVAAKAEALKASLELPLVVTREPPQ